MFANRYTAFIDACCLVGVLKRNLLLTLAEADFYRIRWSAKVLDETEAALAGIFTEHGKIDPSGDAARQRASMETAFKDAAVDGYEHLIAACSGLPDPDDAHVLAAALKTQAATIVTDNLRHFPIEALSPLNLEARSTDSFIADTIDLDRGRAVTRIRVMRERLAMPAMSGETLLLKMEKVGLTETASTLRDYVGLL